MLIFILQVRTWLLFGSFHLFLLFFALGFLTWLLTVLLAHNYRPWTGTFRGDASVVIPVVNEDPQLFTEVLAAIVRQRPREVVVVINGPRNEALEGVCASFGDDVRMLWTPTAGKRNALRLGIEAISGDIAVLVDSDTRWTESTLVELLRPFAEDDIGGVTTYQEIGHPRRTIWTRFADWLELNRFYYSLPAQSVLGQVGTLPGRTIAFRRHLLVDYLPEFLSERFLGVHKEISDDRAMTTYTLRRGYRTVYQSTSRVITEAPETFWSFWRQQYRWAAGGQYQSLRNARWLSRNARVLGLLTFTPIIGGFLFLSTLLLWAVQALSSHRRGTDLAFLRDLPVPLIVLILLASWVVTAIVRQYRVLRARPSHLLWIGPWVLVGITLMLPVRLFAFVTMVRETGWGTRSDGYVARPDKASFILRAVPSLLAFTMLAGFTGLGFLLESA
jgi:hyaluronan synthase